MKKMHAKRSWIFFMVLALVLVLGKTPVFAASVSDFDGLKNAVENGDSSITITGNITVTETLEIKNNVTISGGKTLTAGNLITSDPKSGNIFFVNEGKTLKLDGVTLDGDNKARLIYSNGGKIELKDSTLQNGCPGDKAKANPGGGVFLRGGSLTATDTNFTGNTPGTNTKLPKGDGDLNGGAIYSGSTSANITITGGSFGNNEVKAYGHGAAIYQENGTLTVDGTSFKNNKGHVEGGNAGTQGACIHTRDKVKATISGVTAEIAKGFNTGGFLRSWGSDVTVTDSTFTISGLGDGYGYSGGALCFENGKSKVTGSTFTCIGSKLYHAGGFIDIVGGGEHVIDGNIMTGAGKENGQQIASFGGAISVEEDAKADVTITGNTIKDSSASDNGGAIAIGTHLGKSTPSTVTMSGNTISNAGTLFWGAQHGGGIFIGPDAKVTMSKDKMSDTRSSYGGGIYNEGNLTISGGSSLTGGVGSKLGGEIYNNGDLTVDNATITGNFVGEAPWKQYASHGKNYELGGTNIYAEKSVTIMPKANITTGKDVRVLDGQSKILLTGALTKEIDVSVSETPGGSETQKRRVGYVIAEGTEDYEVTKSDAKNLHYIGRTNKEDANHYSNQPRAAFEDDKSTGEWDFVLDKDNKKVVVGQRVKLIYHGNLGTIGTVDKEEKTVDVYKNPEFWEGEGQLADYKVVDPTLDGSSFMGWYYWKDGAKAGDTDESIQNIKMPDDLKDYLFDFSKVTFQNNVKDTDKIITPNIIHTYAGWSENVSIPVLKEWVSAEDDDKVDVTITLKGGDKEKTLALTKAGNYFDQVEDLPVFTKSYEPNEDKNMNLKFTPKVYSVEETPIAGFTTSYSPQSMIANQVAEVSRFVVTNTKVKTGNVFVKYVTENGTVLEAESKVVENAKVGTDYTTTQKAFDGYEFSKMGDDSAKATGKVVAGDLHVTYVYKKTEVTPQPHTGNVFVKYITEDGKVLEEESPVLENAKVGTAYTTEQKVFKGYDFSKMEENSAEPTGKVVAGDLHVIYVYKKAEAQPPTTKVITQYVDEQGNRLIPDRVGKEPVVEIKGYTYLRTEESDTLIRHIYNKIQEPVHPSGSTLILPTPGTSEPVPGDGLLNKKDHKAYMFGYPDGNFLPERNMTREEATAMFARLLKDYPRERRSYNIPFKDVAESDWSQQAIGFMLEKGMIQGYEDGSFKPKAAISRAEFAAMAARFDKFVVGGGNSFFDVPAGYWAQAAIDSAAAKGWVTGYPDGSFKPERKITRAEVVNITNKMLDRFADRDFVRSHLAEMIQFKDLTEADWAYFPIMEATNGHDYTRKAAQEENWIRLNGEEFRFVVVGRK
ncbi:MAG: S-layer homology domain-containing protein [Peptoniphilaceae bacterium]